MAGLPWSVQQIETVFGPCERITQEAWNQMGMRDEADVVQFAEPILPKRDCKVRIDAAEGVTWTVKEHVPEHAGEDYPAMKLTVTIIDQEIELEHPELGKTISDASPIRLSATPAKYNRAAPIQGQDNDYVYKQLLGMSGDELANLREQGVI